MLRCRDMNHRRCQLTLVLPVIQIVSVVVLVTSALFWYSYRYLSRQCKYTHHHGAARGEPLPSTEQSHSEAHADIDGMENKGLDESDMDKEPSGGGEAETTRLIGNI